MPPDDATTTVSHDDLDAVVNLVERLRVTPMSNPLARWHAMPENEREAFDRIREATDA
jgi:hypothetical protein